MNIKKDLNIKEILNNRRKASSGRCKSVSVKNKIGGFTLEATILFSAILFVVVMLMNYGLLIYQQVFIQNIAESFALSLSGTWNNISKDIGTGFISIDKLKDENLYWRIFESEKDSVNRENAINEYVEFLKKKYPVLMSNRKLEVKITSEENLVIYKKIKVIVSTKIKNPAGGLLAIFGVPREFEYKAIAYGDINDPVDFIRSIDFATDTVHSIDTKYLDGKVENFKEIISSKFEEVYSVIDKFLGK